MNGGRKTYFMTLGETGTKNVFKERHKLFLSTCYLCVCGGCTEKKNVWKNVEWDEWRLESLLYDRMSDEEVPPVRCMKQTETSPISCYSLFGGYVKEKP